jgi:hypothetical protein
MAKRKPKTLWVKIDGMGWVKAPVSYGRTHGWTHGLGKQRGWEPKAKVDMSRRGEVHVVRPKGRLTIAGVG